MEIKLRTPCVGICSTIYGDEICRGCVRTYQEIIHWNGFSDEQKQATLDRLEKQTHQVVKKYIDIIDQNKLTEKLHKHNIKYRSHFHPLCWAHTLLREGADKINKVENFLFLKPRNRGIKLNMGVRLKFTEILSDVLCRTIWIQGKIFY